MAPNWHPAVAAAAQKKSERKLRPHQVAEVMGVTAQHVRRLWRQGKLRGEKTSQRNLKIPESALLEYLESLKSEE